MAFSTRWKQNKELKKSEMRGFDLSQVKEKSTFDARQFRYASLTSQLGDLDVATIAQVEEAAMLCHLRDFQAALRIFEGLPTDYLHHPAVVYEHSQVYWLDWSLYKCEKVLEEGITWGKDHTLDSTKSGIYTLLRVALGRTRAMTRGNLTEGRDAMRECSRWLSNVPVEDYTDVQVQFFLIFLVKKPEPD